jgi:hypothetical protein
VAGEECWHDRVEVTDGVGMVGEELLGGTKLGVGARGSKNDQRRLALARSSWCSGGGGGRTVVSGVAAVVARRGARKRGVALAPTLK